MLKEGYRWLRLGEVKKLGDQLCIMVGADDPDCGGWIDLSYELGEKVSKKDLAECKYRRPLKSNVAARSASTNTARQCTTSILLNCSRCKSGLNCFCRFGSKSCLSKQQRKTSAVA